MKKENQFDTQKELINIEAKFKVKLFEIYYDFEKRLEKLQNFIDNLPENVALENNQSIIDYKSTKQKTGYYFFKLSYENLRKSLFINCYDDMTGCLNNFMAGHRVLNIPEHSYYVIFGNLNTYDRTLLNLSNAEEFEPTKKELAYYLSLVK